MKRLCLGLLVVVALLVVAYRVSCKAPSAELSQTERVAAIFEDGGCLSCHSAEPELPFYASFPIMGDVVVADSKAGYQMFDIEPLMKALKSGEKLSVVDVTKVEKAALDGDMPMAKYYLVHWGSQMTDAKAAIVAQWAEQWRAEYYNDGLGGEPIRPIAQSIEYDEAKAELGRILYHDTRLSIDNTVSCASCHDLGTAGVDNKQYSEGVGGQFGGVNAPTVYNAVYNFVQFWDGRAATLALQAAGPPLNPVEMACESFDQIIAKLAKDRALTRAFKAVYPDGWSEANITDAIAQFEHTLVTPNSRFDKYLRGDEAAITAEELEGYNLFKKYNCATCHVGPNLGGQSYELMGQYADYFADRGGELTVEDNGRFKETALERDRHRFKVPGLRNVALTAPYFHDGTEPELKEAVCKMGTYQVGVELSDADEDKMVAFLKSLTGEHNGVLLTNANDK
ncbi:MAG: heme-binding domain-containing protein [Alistipes sp.]|nr:heme-binding domain-containing protein [Alistipes sp.]